MGDNRDDKLESMLRSRRQPVASPDLAEQIILRAAALPQRQSVSFWRFIRELCAEFHLPKPAYVLAAALALGTVVGLSTGPDGSNGQNGDALTAQPYSPFADENFL
jgi:hypothetical protein